MTNVYIKLISAINTKLIKETLITNNDGQSRMLKYVQFQVVLWAIEYACNILSV